MSDDLEIFRRVSLGNISDALDRLGRTGIIDSHIKPVFPTAPIVGRAITIGVAPATPGSKPLPQLFDLVDSAQPGNIVVVDGQGLDYAFWGDLLATACIERGILGAVIDGGSRDSAGVREIGFPLFSRGTTSVAFIGRYNFVAPNTPVQCGGVSVHPGDVIFADEDGVAVIAAEIVAEVAQMVSDVVAREEQVMARLKTGIPMAAAWDEHVR